jgi:hypothetical protein
MRSRKPVTYASPLLSLNPLSDQYRKVKVDLSEARDGREALSKVRFCMESGSGERYQWSGL